jgi:putative peptidoglycan lipid II flippase
MRRLFSFANRKTLSIGKSAALLAGLSLITMLLGLFRERLLNANFGVESISLDAYRVAFKVPDFMFIVLVSGALSVTFIPVLTARLVSHNKQSAWDLTSSLVNMLAVFTLGASIFIMIFADPIVKHLLAPEMSAEGQNLAVAMMRLIAINPFLFSISSVITSVQQAMGRFFFYALAPAIYNLAIIFGVMFLADEHNIMGVVYGVIIGSIVQLLVAAIGLRGLGLKYHFGINWRHRGLKEVRRLLPQRSADQGMDYFSNLVEISLANRTGVGMINAWEMAYTLHFVPINLIGVALSTAAFPQMTERINQGRPDLFKSEFSVVMRTLIWLAIPTAVIAFFGRGYLVRLLIAEGNSTISDLLGLLVIAIIFRAIFHLISRAFYADHDTATPLKVSIATVGLNIILAIYLVAPGLGGFGIMGLAIAKSFTAVLEVLVLMFILMRRYKGIFGSFFIHSVAKMVSAAGFMAVITYGLVLALPLKATDAGFFILVPKFAAIVSIGLISYILFSYIFDIEEAKPLVSKLKRLMFAPVRIIRQ